MDKKHIFIQPEYVRKFQCNGQKCGAKCCQKWCITIDPATYKKFAELKPRSESEKILSHIRFDKKLERNVIDLEKDGRCPFLTPDDWCSIQRQHGESMLSAVCKTYPRVFRCAGGYYERALMMSCPVVAELIAESTEPMSFEQLELSDEEMQPCLELLMTPMPAPNELIPHFFTMQYAAISILQTRNLSIDGRLIVLGFYIDRLDELISAGRLDEIDRISAVYSSEEFLNSDARLLIADIDFGAEAYIKKMFALLDALYGEKSDFNHLNRRYMDAIADTLEIVVDEHGSTSLSKIASNYRRLNSARREFLDKNSPYLEHYLVNEFFLSAYPWKTPHSLIQNYGIFVSTYKILELSALSVEFQHQKRERDSASTERERLLSTIMNLSANVDHKADYLECVVKQLDRDMLSIMKNLLEA